MTNPLDEADGSIPDLLSHLWASYSTYLHKEIGKRRAAGQQTFAHAQALEKAPALAFISWAKKYLSRHRVVETFAADTNIGVRLSNMLTCLICPAVEAEARGTMQPAGAVNITHGRSGSGRRNAQPTDSFDI